MAPKRREIKEGLAANFIVAMEKSLAHGKAKSNTSFTRMTCGRGSVQKKKIPSILFKNES